MKKELQIKNVCQKGSSNLKQKDVEGTNGVYPVFGASGKIGNIGFYQQENEYIAIVKDGSGIGRVAFMPPKSSVIGTMQYILPKEDYDIKYIGYCLQSLDLSAYKQGAAIPHIYFRDYGERNVRVETDKKAQQQIVEYLDTTFEKIDRIKEKAEKKIEDAKGLFQAALNEKLKMREGWKEMMLKEISEIKGGKRVPKGYKLEVLPTSHRYIRVSDFNDNGSVDMENIHYINEDIYRQIKRYTITSEDVYISIAGTIGKSGIIPQELNGSNLTENACKLVLRKNIVCKYYVYYYTISTYFNNQIKKLTKIAAQPKLAITRLATLNIPVPPLATQQQIVTDLDALNEKTNAIEHSCRQIISECDNLKQAILKQVFE